MVSSLENQAFDTQIIVFIKYKEILRNTLKNEN